MANFLRRWLCIGWLLSVVTLVAETTPYAWRGVMIDTSRHFPSLAELRGVIDTLQAANLNVLHLHLTDGPGWRLEVPAYPRLMSVAAWRVDKTDQPWQWRATEFDTTGKPRYGGYYSVAELRELNTYALARGITIVPEVDVPGHSAATLVAYPSLACPTNREPAQWLRGKDVLCIAAPETFTFLSAVIEELCEIFPNSPIHIGCDEVPTLAWRECPLCQHSEVQKRFYQALIDKVRALGHEVVAWDELATVGVDVSHVRLMCWHDDVQPREQDIACPYSYCYLDQNCRPITEWRPPVAIHGVQLNLWTEEMPTAKIRQAKLMARLAPFAAIAQRNFLNQKERTNGTSK